MTDIDLELDALEEARAVVAGEAGRVPGLGDRLGPAATRTSGIEPT